MKDGMAIRIGDKMIGKYKSTPAWYECKVVGMDGGRWVVERKDGDTEDTLKEPRHLKKGRGERAADDAVERVMSVWEVDTEEQRNVEGGPGPRRSEGRGCEMGAWVGVLRKEQLESRSDGNAAHMDNKISGITKIVSRTGRRSTLEAMS